jgi:uncharacterized Tic20 family protein
MQNQILECHTAWIPGYIGYVFLLFILKISGALSLLGFLEAEQAILLFIPAPIIGLTSCLYVCLKAQDRYPSIASHCRESINFQISYTGYQLLTIFYLYSSWAGQSHNPYTNNNLGLFGLILMLAPLVVVIELCRFTLTYAAIIKVLKGAFYYYPGNLRLWK